MTTRLIKLDLGHPAHRVFLSILLLPVFWLLLLWILYVSPANPQLELRLALGVMAGISLICSYCVTLFVAAILRSANEGGSSARMDAKDAQVSQ